jgi:hypothetical protein
VVGGVPGTLSTTSDHTPEAADLTFTALTKTPAITALAVAVFALAGCGESAQDKAKTQVCNARTDISKQIDALSGLTLSSSSIATAKTSLEAIGKDLTQIKNAQHNLAPARRQEVEAATQTFTSKVSSIAAGLSASFNPATAETQFKSALSQLTSAYKQTLAPINCA